MDLHAVTPDELRAGGEPPTALTFDDVLLVPWHSQVLPTQVDVATRFTRNIRVNVPLVSAAMDTVTESRLAIAMAQHGGIGVIHKNLTIEEQASEVDRVKRSESGMIVNPITLSPDPPDPRSPRADEPVPHLRRADHRRRAKEGRLVGILTNRDLRFETNVDRPISAVMTKENLITVPVGTTLDEAREILHKHKVEKLLVVDQQLHAEGAHHRQGHPEGDQVPERVQGRAGAPAGRRGRRRRQGHDRSRGGAGRRARGRARRRHGARALAEGDGHGRRAAAAFPDVDLVAGNVATGQATKRSHRASASTRSRSASAPGRSARRAWSPGSACR